MKKYYVSDAGNDNNSGTQSHPWKTKEKLRIVVAFGFLVLALFLFGVPIQAETVKSVNATWTMSEPIETDLAGYKLYLDDQMVCNFVGGSLRTGSCEVQALADGDNIFTLTAYDTAGNESEKSLPASYNPVPSKPGQLIIFKFEIQLPPPQQ